MLLENVKVLAMDAMYDDQSATPYIAGGAATIELDPGDAEYFTTARAARGEITLALRSVFEPDVEIESKPRGRAVEVVRYGRS